MECRNAATTRAWNEIPPRIVQPPVESTMKKTTTANEDARDASLRVSKRVRDSLKAAAAVMGRPLYDVTNEAISQFLSGLRLGDPLAAIRRAGRTRR
jgi:hypothetical protein